jgi:hypothetical protein
LAVNAVHYPSRMVPFMDWKLDHGSRGIANINTPCNAESSVSSKRSSCYGYHLQRYLQPPRSSPRKRGHNSMRFRVCHFHRFFADLEPRYIVRTRTLKHLAIQRQYSFELVPSKNVVKYEFNGTKRPDCAIIGPFRGVWSFVLGFPPSRK